MDLWHVSVGVSGFILGWSFKSSLIEKEEVKPCVCQCNCHHKVDSTEGGTGLPSFGIWVVLFVGVLILVANLAVAFKVTVASKEDQKELAVSWAPQQKGGKSRGVFGSGKGLQILG